MPRPSIPTAFRRTLFAAGLIAAVLGFARPADAAPLCASETFFDTGIPGDGALGDGSICRNFTSTNNSAYYYFDFGTAFENLLRITVDTVLQDFGLTIDREFLSSGTTFGPLFPNYTCVAYGVGGQCVQYTAALPPIDGVEYSGQITWLIAWAQPIGTSPIPEILHETSLDPDSLYDEVLQGVFFDPTLGPANFACDNPYYQTCSFGPGFNAAMLGDPARAAVSDNFTSVVLAQNIPEPGTLALLGIGLCGYAVRSRRAGQN